MLAGTLEVPRCAGPIRALHLHGTRDALVPFAGTPWSAPLSAFLRPVPTIAAAAPGSSITVRTIEGHPHRWTAAGDPVDVSRELWAFARMSEPA